MAKDKKIMNEEIQKYPIYILNKLGQLIGIYEIKSTNDYNHYEYNLHHFIEYQKYVKDPGKYERLGISQKLILVSIPLHEQLHNQAIKTVSDEEFKQYYKIEKSKLIYKD